MKAYFFSIAFLFFSMTVWSKETQIWDNEQFKIKRLREALRQSGAVKFVERDDLPEKAPRIHSKSWVDRLPKEDQARNEYEQEVREFGYDFVLELEKLALPNIAVEDVDRLEKHADDLLKIAEWLKTESGYGNYLLKSWAEHIALSAIGGLAINSSCSTNRIFDLLLRVDNISRDLDYRLAILNEEGPHKFMRPKETDEVGIWNNFARQWARHFRLADQHFTANGNSAFPIFEAVKQFPWEYSFYVDDRYVGFEAPSSAWWNSKDHRVLCVVGARDNRLIKMIKGLLKFRAVVGYVPKPDSSSLDFFTDGDAYNAQLDILWQECGQAMRRPAIANTVFMIYSHTFYDGRTQGLEWRLRHERQQQ